MFQILDEKCWNFNVAVQGGIKFMYVHACTHVYIYVHDMYVHMYIHMYITHIQVCTCMYMYAT